MKKRLMTVMVVSLFAVPVLAVPSVTVDRGVPGDLAVSNPMIGGGEYRIVPNADLIAISSETGPFMSFCLELMEPIDDTGGSVYVADITSRAFLGGSGDLESPPLLGDPLSPETAWLYTQYRNGSLEGFDGSPDSVGALQTAIWYLEDELFLKGATGYLALPPEVQYFVNAARDSGWTDIHNVRVLNLYTEISGKRVQYQDMLIMIPAPGAFVLGAIGVCVVGWFRARRAL